MEEELDKKQVKKDIERWAKKLREVYLEMAEIYQEVCK